jgi:cob(I)alamin adenosyltransferase
MYGAARVSKDSPLIEAYGTIDELNSYLGVIRSDCKVAKVSASLRKIQSLLFVAGADLATDLGAGTRVPRVTKKETRLIEEMTDELLSELPKLSTFILPGGTTLAARLQFARAICRRAERRIVTASKAEKKVNSELIPFFNRLSSYFFNLARYVNSVQHFDEEAWKG